MFDEKEYQRQYRLAHKEESKKYKKEYYQEHKEKILNGCKEYYNENKDEVKARVKEYQQTSEKDKLRRSKYRDEHQPEIKQYRRDYRVTHPDKIIEHDKKWRDHQLLRWYRSKDKDKCLTCDLTIDWIKENITNKSCVYCGDIEQIGCDRIDNNKGHTMDNVVPCCRVCNVTRNNNFSMEEMHLIGATIRTIKENRLLKVS